MAAIFNNGRHIFHRANLECLHIQKCLEYINLHVCQFWCFQNNLNNWFRIFYYAAGLYAVIIHVHLTTVLIICNLCTSRVTWPVIFTGKDGCFLGVILNSVHCLKEPPYWFKVSMSCKFYDTIFVKLNNAASIKRKTIKIKIHLLAFT